MRFDLLDEHDRFIPGWHLRPEPSSMRAEFTRPEWRWPATVRRASQAVKAQLLTILRLSLEACRGALVFRPAATRHPAGNPNPTGS